MKLKFLLFLLFIIGITLIQCEDDCDENYNLRNSIISEVTVYSNSVQDSAITSSYLSLSLQIEGKVVSNLQSSGLVNACEPMYPGNYLNSIDSVSITLNRDYGFYKAGESFIDNLKFEYTNEIVTENDLFNLMNARFNTPRFKLINPPTQKDTFQFTFVFKDNNDSLFIAKSKPIIITP